MPDDSKISISYWEQSTFYKAQDVIIVGGGLTALHTAIQLKMMKPNCSILIIERHSIPQGAATRNAGFACFGSPSELLSDLNTMTEDEVITLARRRQKGLAKLRALVGDKALQYQENGGFEVFTSAMQGAMQRCLDHLPRLNMLMGSETYCKVSKKNLDDLGLRLFIGAISIAGEGMLHTGHMVTSLIRLAQQYEVNFMWGMPIDKYETSDRQVKLISGKGIVFTASKVVFATNAFSQELISDLPINSVRNQVLVTSPIQGLKLKGTYHCDEGFIYFRELGDRVLIGGARNRFQSESTGKFGTTDEVRNYLYGFLKEHLRLKANFSVDYHWSGILAMGPTKEPVIKQIEDRIVVVGRLAGMGVAISSLIGEEVASLVLN